MPPNSGGRCGAHSLAFFTLPCTWARNSCASCICSRLGRPPSVRCAQSLPSLGRMSLLTISAVLSRTSLTSAFNVGTGLTFMGMAHSSCGIGVKTQV